MATTRSKKAKASAPVEEKQVEAPKAKEVKEAPKPVEKKVEPPKEEAPKAKEVKEAPKPAPKKVEKSKELQVGSLVSTPTGKAIVKSLEDNIVVVYKETNKKVSYRFLKEEVKLKG
jgi:hypothetical protein